MFSTFQGLFWLQLPYRLEIATTQLRHHNETHVGIGLLELHYYGVIMIIKAASLLRWSYDQRASHSVATQPFTLKLWWYETHQGIQILNIRHESHTEPVTIWTVGLDGVWELFSWYQSGGASVHKSTWHFKLSSCVFSVDDHTWRYVMATWQYIYMVQGQ